MKDLAIILGIRPDVIRASSIIKLLKNNSSLDVDFIWSGQHYSENMKDVFFEQLDVPRPDIEFQIDVTNDASTVASIINQTYLHLEKSKYKAVVFLGDTNTVMGSIGVAQHNIPIVHIEGCMRSYDWRMPEEKYRKTIDHLSDRIYAYLESYKNQGLKEGISKNIIQVTGNPIVDIIMENEELIDSGSQFLKNEITNFIKGNDYGIVTCHRRENILDEKSLKNIINLLNASDINLIFPIGYMTQKKIKEYGFKLNKNILTTEPIGYLEFMHLLKNSNYCISDSGTVIEEACILGIPTIQLRHSTERPEVYEVNSSIKFDPLNSKNNISETYVKLNKLKNSIWNHPFGDGQASKRIYENLLHLIETNSFSMHSKKDYDFDVSRSFLE